MIDKLKRFGWMLLSSIDYILFVFLIIVKLYLFAAMTDTIFVPQGAIGYIKDVFAFIMGDAPERNLRAGLVMVSFGAVFIASFWTLFLKRNKRWISLLVLDGILSFIILADAVYFRYFSDIISSTVLMQFKQVSSLGSSISNLFSWSDLFFVIDLIVLIPIVVMAIKWSKSRHTRSLWLRLVGGVMVLAIGIFCVSYPIKVFLGYGGSWLFEKTISNMRVYDMTGLLGFHGYDAYKFVQNLTEDHTVSAERRNEIQDWFTQHHKDLSKHTEFYGIAEGKNVIVIQMEAFQAMLLDRKINGQEITPNLNKLMKDSMYFNHFYDMTASGRTSDAEFMLNTSLFPLPSGSAYITKSGNEYSALPEIMKENGYSTHAYHAYKKSFWNRYIMYQTLGFDKFHSLEDYEATDTIGWSITDKAFLNQTADKIAKQKKPSYSMLITLTSHYPFEFPDKYKELNLEGFDKEIFKNYLQSAHYVDEALGNFFKELKDRGLWDDSVIMLYGDHDSGFMTAESEMSEVVGVKGKPIEYEMERNRIPLIIHLPGDKKAGVYEKAMGHIDLAPTLLHLLGEDLSDEFMMGSPAFLKKDDLVVFRTGSFITNEVLFNAAIDGVFEHGQCYDLKLKEEVNLVNCQDGYDKAIKRLNISDTILESDFIRVLEKSKQ